MKNETIKLKELISLGLPQNSPQYALTEKIINAVGKREVTYKGKNYTVVN